jgi:hypothetical protein
MAIPKKSSNNNLQKIAFFDFGGVYTPGDLGNPFRTIGEDHMGDEAGQLCL